MAVAPDNSTMIAAESYRRRLTAFDIGQGGDLSNRRVWADLVTDVPGGICMDSEGAIWYADVPNRHCVRVREGGEVLQTITVDRGCFPALAVDLAAGRCSSLPPMARARAHVPRRTQWAGAHRRRPLRARRLPLGHAARRAERCRSNRPDLALKRCGC
jgi:hypothetical protein